MALELASVLPRRLPHLLCAGALLATLAPTTGCLFGGYDGVFIEAEDVRLDIPTSSQGFRAEGDINGDAWLLITHTATDVNGWVTTVVETSSYVIEFLNNHRETSRDGDWRVYGPFDDNRGNDVAWMVRIAGDDLDTQFEFLVADKGTTNPDSFVMFADGDLTVDDEMRMGKMHIDFDTIEMHPDLDSTALWEYEGDITIEFERNTDSGDKTIDIDFDAFTAARTGFLDDDVFTSDETYHYSKKGSGSGVFHLALMGEWDTYPHTWSGPEQERMQLDMVWNDGGEGRARGLIQEVDGVGDMKHGDLSLEECFNGDGYLTWRELSELYANEVPDYNFGDSNTCVYTDEDLG